MDAGDLKRGSNVCYKLKTNDGWTVRLRYIGETRRVYVFRACVDPKPVGLLQTSEFHLVPKPLTDAIREFVRCKSSGAWQEAPHVCGRNCEARCR